jgi:hypothetical protein
MHRSVPLCTLQLMLISNKFWIRDGVGGEGWEGGDWGVSGGEARGPSLEGENKRGGKGGKKGGFT